MQKSKNSNLPRIQKSKTSYVGKVIALDSVHIDQTIWVFWGGPMPDYIMLCLETINRHRGSFDFVVVTPETIFHYLPDLPEKWSTDLAMWAQKSDIFSTAILRKYGGIALDADVIALKSLSDVFSEYMQSEDFCVFLNAERTPSVGYMMARSGTEVICTYYDRQIEILLREDHFDNKFILFGSQLLSKVIADHAKDRQFDSMLGRTALFYWKSWSSFSTVLHLSDYTPNLPQQGSALFLIQLYNHNLSKESLLSKDCDALMSSGTLLADCFAQAFSGLTIGNERYIGWESEITFVVKTFMRSDLCVESVRKIRSDFPHASIIICDDGNEHAIGPLIKGMRISYLTMPFDSGLSAGRNYLLQHVSTKYFFLSDDDATVEDSASIRAAYATLERHQRLHIVAGYEESSQRELIRYSLVKRDDIIYHYRDAYGYLGFLNRVPLYHMVENVFLARTSAFAQLNVLWDEDLKVSEHLEFFYRYRNKLLITFLPEMKFLQLTSPTSTSQNYARYRNRSQEFWTVAKQKMSIVNTGFSEYTFIEKCVNKLKLL